MRPRRSVTSPVSRLAALALLLLTAACDLPPVRQAGAGESPAESVAPPAAAVQEAPAQDTTPALEIRFLDVGQGDAALLRSQGRTALIDAGPTDAIVRRLRELGVDTIDLLVASHNHADHIGGADAVLDSLPVRFYLDNRVPATTRIQERVLERVASKEISYLAPTARSIALGSARLVVIPPPESVAGDEQNNHSVGILAVQSGFAALFTGDSETEELNAFLERDSVPDVDVLKAAHHGSRNGVTPAWLARTRPEVVVISAGADNSYGHPHAAAMRYYCTGGRRVLRTDVHGEVTVTIAADGSYSVAGERDGSPGC
jgi:competence protein ComEC